MRARMVAHGLRHGTETHGFEASRILVQKEKYRPPTPNYAPGALRLYRLVVRGASIRKSSVDALRWSGDRND
jgi:hypothetical protein